jgi:uncharacterized membrane protein YgdD (TMEM256/DUF423 family)
VDYSRLFLTVGAAGGGTAVMLGAFAAHGLRGRLDAALLHAFETAVTYQFFHSIALCVLALWCRQLVRQPALGDAAVLAGILFVSGLVLFCGSLYALTFGAPRWVGPITPLGGVAFIGGWAALCWSAWRN